MVKTVCNVKSQTVNVKFVYPALYTIHNVIGYGRISQVELYKVVVALPALVPETVIVIGIAVKAYMEPILVWRVPSLLQNILECPEAATYMIEHAVDDNLYASLVAVLNYLAEVVICTETTVNLCIVSCVVAVSI